MRQAFFILSFLFLACFSIVLTVTANSWKTFKNEKNRYTITYPTSWHLLDDTIDTLTIVNFPPDRRVKGVVMPPSGAGITVVPAPPGIAGISAWEEKDLLGSTPLNRQRISAKGRTTGACSQLVQTEWESEEGPDTYSHQTVYYCASGNRLYRVELSNWRGNPNQTQLQKTALRMVLSLRSW